MKKIYALIISTLFCLDSIAQDSWTQKAPMTGVRENAAGFSIGTKGYLGTGKTGSTVYQDLWEWDQTTNVWTQKANIPIPRYFAVGFAIGAKGYIGTGMYNSTYLNDLWEYDPSANTWTSKATLTLGRFASFGFSIGTKGYIGAGYNSGNLQDFWEWDQASNSWSQMPNFPTYRENAVSFSIGTKGYVGTGDIALSLQNDFWEYNPATFVWTQKANFGGGVRGQASGFSIGNKGYIGAGLGPSNTYPVDFWEYDPASDTWNQKANFGGAARRRGVGFSVGTKGYIGTGWDGSVTKLDFWEWASCTTAPSQPGTITGPTAVCNGSTNNYSITAVSGATSYTWVLPGGWTGTSTTTSISATANSTGGTISVTANNACGSSTAQTLAVTVNIVTASTSSTFTTCGTCCDGTATTVPSGGSAPYTYVWSPSGGSAATASGLCNGTYTVCITDAIGCTTCSTVNVSFNVGMDQNNNENNFSIYPNPFDENIFIQFDHLSGNTVAEIFNMLGERIFISSLTSHVSDLDLSKIESGIYFLKITTGEGSITKKIIKE